MAITIRDVQQGTGSSTTSAQTAAFASNPVSGEAILVSCAAWRSGAGLAVIQAPTDTAGNTYIQVGSTLRHPVQTSQHLALFYAQNITGGASFRVTMHTDVAVYGVVIAWALSGVPTSGLYNNDAVSAQGSSTTVSSGPTSPAHSLTDSLFLSIATTNVNNSEVPGTGWNLTGVNGFTSTMDAASRYGLWGTINSNYTEYLIGAAPQTGSWTNNAGVSARSWLSLTASFGGTAAAGGARRHVNGRVLSTTRIGGIVT